MLNAEDAVCAAIDELERDSVDDLVDWQMSESPAAEVEHGGLLPRAWQHANRQSRAQIAAARARGYAGYARYMVYTTEDTNAAISGARWVDESEPPAGSADLVAEWQAAQPHYGRGAYAELRAQRDAPRRLLATMRRIEGTLRDLGVWQDDSDDRQDDPAES